MITTEQYKEAVEYIKSFNPQVNFSWNNDYHASKKYKESIDIKVDYEIQQKKLKELK